MVYSIQAFTMMIASPFWGALADRYGRKPMVVRAMLGGGISILLMSFAATAEQLIFLRGVQGLFSGVMSAVSALVVSKVPRDKTGYAMGILQLGLWGGVALGPLLGGFLADLFGFRMTFMATAFLLCASGVSIWIAIDESYTPVINHARGGRSFVRSWHRILSYPGLMATFMIRFLCSIGRTALSPILPLFVQALRTGNPRTAGYTGLILGLSSAASTIAAVYLGRLGDRVGHHRIALFSGIVTALFFFPQTLVNKPWQLMVLYAVTGAGIGGLTPSLSALLARLSKPTDAGSVYGIDNSITAAGRTLSPLIAALVVAWFGLRWVFCATGLVFVAVAAMTALFLSSQAMGRREEEAVEIIELELSESE
jgi:DHA1 family multidrug resistance protein-like MFS transporter